MSDILRCERMSEEPKNRGGSSPPGDASATADPRTVGAPSAGGAPSAVVEELPRVEPPSSGEWSLKTTAGPISRELLEAMRHPDVPAVVLDALSRRSNSDLPPVIARDAGESDEQTQTYVIPQGDTPSSPPARPVTPPRPAAGARPPGAPDSTRGLDSGPISQRDTVVSANVIPTPKVPMSASGVRRDSEESLFEAALLAVAFIAAFLGWLSFGFLSR